MKMKKMMMKMVMKLMKRQKLTLERVSRRKLSQFESCNNSLTSHWSEGKCGSHSQCCSLNNSTQFYKQLPQPTTDDIEMRLCRDERGSNENIFIDMIDITYVQLINLCVV